MLGKCWEFRIFDKLKITTMARVKVLLKSDNNPAPIYIRLTDGRQVDVMAKTKYIINPKEWSSAKEQPKNLKDVDFSNLNNDLLDLKSNLVKHYNKTKNNLVINTQWLKDFLDPSIEVIEESKIPTTLIHYIDYYLEFRKHELQPSTVRKIKVVYHKLERFELHRKKIIQINEINSNFKNEFLNYFKSVGYAQNTLQRDWVQVKTFCRHARHLGIAIHHQLDDLQIDKEKVTKIYLTNEELAEIEKANVKVHNKHYEDARDWLIISCYTGQRISDFMKFTKDQIRIENGKSLIEFTQVKTGKIMTVPLHPKVLEILKKRNGNFPEVISDSKYNLYIKEVCRIAKLKEKVKGSLKVETAKKSKIYRKVTDNYEKWKLVSSHIGRRSFATNFYGKIPTTYLIYVTGHSTEKMFLSYIGKSNKDLAMELTNYF